MFLLCCLGFSNQPSGVQLDAVNDDCLSCSLCPGSQTLVDICSLLPGTRIPELVISILALFVLILVKELNGCYREKLPLPIPIELIVVSELNSSHKAPAGGNTSIGNILMWKTCCLSVAEGF